MRSILVKTLPLVAALVLAGAAQAQIKIGVAGPITGANASFGAQLTEGVAQAAADIDAKGGILGQQITVEQGDDVSDPKQGVSVANKFVGDGVKYVVGHFNSGVTIPASEVYADNGVLFITPSATNPKVTDRGLWDAFRTCGRDDQQGKLWADLALTKLKDAKIAIVHDKTPYGQGLADAARGFMNAGGKKEVLYEGVNTGEKDYSAIVSKIKASGADYLMWGGLHTEGGLIVRQMRDQGMKTDHDLRRRHHRQRVRLDRRPRRRRHADVASAPSRATIPTPRRSSPNSRPRASSRRAIRSIPTPRCRSSSRRRRRPIRSTRRRWRRSCTPASRSTP